MANQANTTLLNFVGGEISPLMEARTDLDIFAKSFSWCQNFIIVPQGAAMYRPGSFMAGLTSGNQNAIYIPFQFSADDAVIIVATNQKFRFYRNSSVILNSSVNINGISQAAQALVSTTTPHGLTTGQEVYITGVNGMTQLNGRFFIVSTFGANAFYLNDQWGNPINTLPVYGYGAYTSGGTVASIYELTTPYLEPDLSSLRYAQVGDLMRITCWNTQNGAAYPPQLLTRKGFTNWTLATFTRTNDPFTPTAYAATGISRANPCVVTCASTTGMTVGDILYVTGVIGMTQLNGNFYTVAALTSTTFTLNDLNGNPINSTGYTAWTSGGSFTETNQWPRCVAFSSDGRQVYAATKQNPEGYWASELPSGTTTNYDNFTTGSAANDAMIFDFAPVEGVVDTIQEIKQFSGNFALLGSSSIRQVYGSATGQPPTPNNINTIPTIQGADNVMPVVINWDLLFVDVNGKKLRGLQYNLAFSDYEAVDYNLSAEHLGLESQFIKIVRVKGIPDIVWVLRADGVLLSFTFNNIENIAGWARHYVGGNGKVLDISSIRNANGDDQLWLIVQRTLSGQTYTSVEVMSDWPTIPLRLKFFSGNQSNDLTNWQNATMEALKETSFLDMALTYDGTARGSAANATLTPSAVSGNAITITASQAVFNASDVGSQIWKNYSSTGSGGGAAVITAFVSTTQVTCNVLSAFDTTAAMAAGAWRFAVNQLQNLHWFNGQVVNVQADGGTGKTQAVENGILNLQSFAGTVQVGFGYTGLAITQNLDIGGKQGSAASKPRNIKRLRMRFKDSAGLQVGTSPYNLNKVNFRQAGQNMSVMPPLYSGMIDLPLLDSWSNNTKQVVFMQTDPVPCTVLALDIEMHTNEPP